MAGTKRVCWLLLAREESRPPAGFMFCVAVFVAEVVVMVVMVVDEGEEVAAIPSIEYEIDCIELETPAGDMMVFEAAVDVACVLTEWIIETSRTVQTSCSCLKNMIKERVETRRQRQ